MMIVDEFGYRFGFDFHVRKSNAKNIVASTEWSPKESQQQMNINKNEVQHIYFKKVGSATTWLLPDMNGEAVSAPRMPKNTHKSIKFCASYLHRYKNRRTNLVFGVTY